MSYKRLAILFVTLITPSAGFSSALFQERVSNQVFAPAVQPGVEIELPDFSELFLRISETSPLARVAMQGGEVNGKRGLAAVEAAQGRTASMALPTSLMANHCFYLRIYLHSCFHSAR